MALLVVALELWLEEFVVVEFEEVGLLGLLLVQLLEPGLLQVGA